MKQYPEYNQGQDFNIAGESYAGTYIPQFASYIHEKQKGRKHSAVSPVEEHTDINLRNLLIGNGLTDPYYQFASVPDYACAPSEHAFVDESQCTTWVPRLPFFLPSCALADPGACGMYTG